MIYKEKQILELTESLVAVNKDDISISLKSNRKHKILQVMDGAPKKLVYTPDTQQYSFFKLVYYTQQLHKQLFNDSDIQSASGHYQKSECLKLWMFLPFFFQSTDLQKVQREKKNLIENLLSLSRIICSGNFWFIS